MDKKEEILGENQQDLPAVEAGITAIPVSDDEDDEQQQEAVVASNGHLESSQPENGLNPEVAATTADVGLDNSQSEEPDVSNVMEVEPDAVSDVDESLPVPEQMNVIDEISVAHEMNHYMKVNSINWLELSDKEEMWAVCDAISAAHSGLPDSLLKEAFLHLLQGHLNKTPKQKHSNSYLRIHLEGLLRIWNLEVKSDKPTDRATKFIAAPAAYSPPVVKRRRGNASPAQICHRGGELDVDEDEHGTICIGGQELSFESWAQLNKIKESDIVHSSVVPPRQKRPRPQHSKHHHESQIQVKEIEEPKRSSPLSLRKTRLFRRWRQGDSEAARGRRRKRRVKERRKAPTSVNNMNQMFSKFYQFRFQIAQNLSLQQKASFLDLIKQSNGASVQPDNSSK
uniref:Uncharacterized protein n=1 Tax=Ditylenchus dipsaci TaxID=166011 RepID=A0A915EHD6_9BILA